MNRSLMWRGLLILALVVLAGFSVYPPREKINLGLDLQGGIHLVLRVKTEDALRSETDKGMERLRQEAEDAGLTGLVTRRTSDTAFEVAGVPLDRAEVVAQAAND